MKKLSDFELLSRLGEGGMGQVFKARQHSMDRLVAIKVLAPRLASDPEYVARFEQEARNAAKLNHPNIVQVFVQGVSEGVRYIAFEFIEGSSLESWLKSHGPLTERESLKIARDVADALRYASEKGLIHRDVKPDNILLTRDFVPKLADLGLARIENSESHLTQTGVVMGTPHYMAPEQAMGVKDLDARADVYALGLVLYRCFTGKLPWEADSAIAILSKHLNEDCPDPRVERPALSDASARLVALLAARDRKARPTPGEAVREIDAVLALTASGAGASASPATLRLPAPSGSGSGGAASAGRGSGGGVAPSLTSSPAVGRPASVEGPVVPPQSGIETGPLPVAAIPTPPSRFGSKTKVAAVLAVGLLVGALGAGAVAKRKTFETAIVRASQAIGSPTEAAAVHSELDLLAARATPDEKLALDRAHALLTAGRKAVDGIRTQGRRALDELGKVAVGGRDGPLEQRVTAEALAWGGYLGFVLEVSSALLGRKVQLEAPRIAPARGLARLLPDPRVLDAVARDLPPVLEAFEKNDTGAARERARSLLGALDPARDLGLRDLVHSLQGIVEVTERLEARDTPLDAFLAVEKASPELAGASFLQRLYTQVADPKLAPRARRVADGIEFDALEPKGTRPPQREDFRPAVLAPLHLIDEPDGVAQVRLEVSVNAKSVLAVLRDTRARLDPMALKLGHAALKQAESGPKGILSVLETLTERSPGNEVRTSVDLFVHEGRVTVVEGANRVELGSEGRLSFMLGSLKLHRFHVLYRRVPTPKG